MKTTLALSMAAFAAFGFPVSGVAGGAFAGRDGAGAPSPLNAARVLLVDDDGTEDHDRPGASDREDDDEEDGCEDGAGNLCQGAARPAPAGTVAPPGNGLFVPGTMPQVTTQ